MIKFLFFFPFFPFILHGVDLDRERLYPLEIIYAVGGGFKMSLIVKIGQ